MGTRGGTIGCSAGFRLIVGPLVLLMSKSASLPGSGRLTAGRGTRVGRGLDVGFILEMFLFL